MPPASQRASASWAVLGLGDREAKAGDHAARDRAHHARIVDDQAGPAHAGGGRGNGTGCHRRAGWEFAAAAGGFARLIRP
jgi:hypothetical protein